MTKNNILNNIENINNFEWPRYRTAPNLDDIKLGQTFSYDGERVKHAIIGLVKANDFDEAEQYYQDIDNTALVQGMLYEIALPLTECLVTLLPFCHISAKFFILDILCMISVGELSDCEVKFNNQNLINECHSYIFNGRWFYQKDGLNNLNTELLPFYCELILFCGEMDKIYSKESKSVLKQIIAHGKDIPEGLLNEAKKLVKIENQNI